MSEFHELRVGDHVSLLSGFPFNSEYFDQEEGIRLIRIRDLLNPDGETYFRGPFDPKWVVRPQDILIGMDGDFNIVRWKGSEALLNQRILKVEAKSNGLIDEGYFFYWCAPLLQQIHNQTAATTVKHLSVKDIERAKGRFPDKHIQSLIAEILSTLDETIEQTEALIAKMHQVKAGLMHDLFTRGVTPDGRLRPTREQVPELYKESPLGWIPREWETKTIAAIAESLVDGPFGSNLKSEHYVDEPGVRVVRLQNIQEGCYDDHDPAFVSQRHADYLSRNEVNSGDVLIAALGDENYPVGRACCYPAFLPPAINKADCFRLRCSPVLARNEFLMHFLNTAQSRSQIRRFEQGVTRRRTNLGNLRRVIVALPDIREQDKIVQMLSAVSQQVEAVVLQEEKLCQQKYGLMQDLLTGRVGCR